MRFILAVVTALAFLAPSLNAQELGPEDLVKKVTADILESIKSGSWRKKNA